MGTSKLRLVLLAASVLLVGCDHWTKHAAKRDLEGRPPHTLISGMLDLSYTENTDSGFGLMRSLPVAVRTPILTSLQLLAGAAFLLVCLRGKTPAALRLALLLVSAGAWGNGLDRLARGYVVDFMHIHHWPVFNLADVYITAGGILLAVGLRSGLRARKPSPAP